MSQPEALVDEVPARLGYVILVDALGTKGATAHSLPQTIVERWNVFLRDTLKWVEKLNKASGNKGSIAQSIPFSDTAYICIEPRRDKHITDVIWLDGFAPILRDAIGAGVFLRGAISYGLYYYKGSQVFGPAVEEAAAWYEEADWIGVAATPSLCHILDLLAEQDDAVQSDFFVMHEVPFKKPEMKSIAMWALGWPLAASSQDNIIGVTRTAFIEHGGTVPPNVFPKFHNTIRFIKKCNEINKDLNPSDDNFPTQ